MSMTPISGRSGSAISASPEAGVAAGESLSRSYRVNLNVLALVALFTGGLLVFSTQALAVVRRRSQLALLRVLGMTRRGLATLLVVEGAIVGIVGSALGLAGGGLPPPPRQGSGSAAAGSRACALPGEPWAEPRHG